MDPTFGVVIAGFVFEFPRKWWYREVEGSFLRPFHGHFFPVRAWAQGSLLVRSPSCRGWSSRDSADFRSTKIVVRRPFLEKISEILTKNSAQKMAFHDLISIAGAVWLKNANRSKIGFETSENSRKIVVPEPLVFYWFGGFLYLF